MMTRQLTMAKTVRQLREERGWTLAMLEAATHHRVSASTLSRVERGEVDPFRKTKEDVAAAFGVPVTEIEWIAKASGTTAEEA